MAEQKLQDKLMELQLEEALATANDRKQRRANKENKSKAIEYSLRRDRRQTEIIQASCVHKKGGKGKDGIYNGNDSNFAVITHTLSHGPTIVVCQRCGKLWGPPTRLARNASPAQRTKYVEDLNDYRRALAMPTDNEPSGTVLFEIIVDEAA